MVNTKTIFGTAAVDGFIENLDPVEMEDGKLSDSDINWLLDSVDAAVEQFEELSQKLYAFRDNNPEGLVEWLRSHDLLEEV